MGWEMTLGQKDVIVVEIDRVKVAELLHTSEVFTPVELANKMQVTVQTLHNWRKTVVNGKPLLSAPHRVGNYTFWTAEQVAELKENRKGVR